MKRAARTPKSQPRSNKIESLETRRLMAIVVNTTLDESVANATTSLREAIVLAADNAGDDTITFDPTIFSPDTLHTITPAVDEFFIDDASGKLTIQGPGTTVLAISGSSAGRAFNIDNSVNASISGMTITDGIGLPDGGAIRNAGTLELDDVVITNNSAKGADGQVPDIALPGEAGGNARGGAIYNSGDLTITDSFFTNNSATGGNGGSSFAGGGEGGDGIGGAIYTTGPLNVTDTEFAANTAVAGQAGGSLGAGMFGASAYGGALFAEIGATTFITSSSFSFNSATASDGASAALAGSGGIGGSARGGAIYTNSADFTLINSTVNNNAASGGKGGEGVGSPDGDGGTARGGGIAVDGNFVMAGGSIENNNANGGASDDAGGGNAFGGGAYNEGSVTFTDVAFSLNAASGGVSNTGNGGDGDGGGLSNHQIAAFHAASLVENSAVGGASGANSGDGRGGGIYNTNSGSLAINGTTLSSNFALGGTGTSGTVAGSGGAGQGGGVMNNSGTTTIFSSTLDNNYAYGGSGGDASAGDGGQGGQGRGGAVSNSDTVKVTNSTLYANHAYGGDGGNGTGQAGSGGHGFGGAVFSNGASLVVINATLANNDSFGGVTGSGAEGSDGTGRGGGIYSTGPTASLTNTIVDNGTADEGPNVAGTLVVKNSLISVTDGAFSADTGSANNLFDTPANLGTLEDNGGITHTVVPNPGSQVVDAGDDDAAIAEFGLDGLDQRGDFFPRFNGTVDMGAVESGGGEIDVSGNGSAILDGDLSPETGDNTDFGVAITGGAGVQRSFLVENFGSSALTISDLVVPAGFEVVEPLDSSIAPGESDSFIIQLTTASAGTYLGNVVISSNDLDNPAFTFAITGTVNDPAPSTPGIHINFQPSAAPVPVSFLSDVGSVFGSRGNGYSYGWNQSISSAMRDRNVLSDQAKDTLTHMQLYGNRTWEISLPNGTYRVHLMAGDASYFDSTYKLNVEGTLAINGKPTSGNRFLEGTVTVKVTDGKLTVANASGAVNNKINYIDITPVLAVNFQTSGSSTPSGYLADSGAVFGNRGNGNSYGWNSSASSFSRDRNSGLSPDQRYDTLIHTQLYGNRTWEFALPNGSYDVRVVAGDASYIDSVYRYNVEGILALNGTPNASKHWIEGIVTVAVSDGKLTISNASGAVNNKLAFVEITPVS